MRMARLARLLVVTALAATGNVAILAAPAAAEPEPQARMVGEEKTANVQISGTSSGHVIHEPGATYVKVHLRLSPGAHVSVSNLDGTEVHTYHGTVAEGDSDRTLHGRAGFGALSIDGDTAVITRHQGSVRIDGYWRGYTEEEVIANNPGILSVCNTDARRDVVCYQNSHPTEYARGRAVARLLIGGGGACTTWRVGNTNRMLTNKHCFSTQSQVESSEMQFNYQCATCGGKNPGAGTKVSGAQLLKVSTGGSGELDYALYSVNSFSTIQTFGTLYLETRAPTTGERIYIPGHGDAAPKRLSIYEDSQGGTLCTVRSANYNSWNMSYSCDTSGGNSGSPVLSANHRVLALHHLGGCPNNQGARMHLIYNEIASLIDNNSGWSTTVDNTTAGRFTASSNWGTSTWNSRRYGADYRFATPNTTASDPAWYKVNIPETGQYRVSVWYPADSGYNDSTPFMVVTTSGTQSVRVNQRLNGGTWVSLGTFTLAAGDSNKVGVSRWTSGTGYVIADAVRITRV